MFSQPRINDIASLYQGNPGALQQRIQQEQQAKPGLPPDLQKLLALQIITSEQDAMKRNQALQQLQQTGQQPTVAQSVEQKAKQALQSRMLQEQRKQQGLQALAQQAPPGPIPEGVPQPERQPEPQGLDQLPANIGEFAGGGIVAFNGEGESEVPKPKRQYTLQEQGEDWVKRKIEAEMAQEEAARRSAESAGRIPGESRRAPEGGERIEGSEFGRNVMNTLAALPGAGAARAFSGGIRGLAAALAGLVGGDRANAPEVPAAAPAQPAPRQPAPGEVAPEEMAGFDRATAEYMARRGAPPAPRAEPPAAPRTAPPVATPAAAPATVLPTAAAPAREAPTMPKDIRDSYNAALRASLAVDPEAQRKAETNRFRSEVGERPTASLETLAQEIAAQRRKITERADPMTDLLRGIALSPRGERWMFSGARGAEYADRVQAAREAQLLDLMKQQMEAQSKIEESKYGFKEKAFTIGNEAYKNAYESKRKALEAAGMDAREADKLAKDYAQMASNEAIEASRRASAEKIAGMPARVGVSPSEERYIREWMKNNPGKTYVDAYEAYKMSGMAGKENRSALIEKYAQDWNKMDIMERNNLKAQGILTREDYINDMLRITGQATGKDMGAREPSGPVSVTAGGKTYQFPSQAAADKFKAQAGIK